MENNKNPDYIKPQRIPKKHNGIRNKKKKEKFDGVDPAHAPKHQPYARMRHQDISRILESGDE